MTLTSDPSNPVLNSFTIDFDDSTATDDDVKIHTVNYEVEMIEYSGIVSKLTDSFTFEITCPASLTSSSLVSPI